jgi:tellurite methyltransferase
MPWRSLLSPRLVERDLLDPREADLAATRPIAGAVNIPFSELPRRTQELPPRSRVARVAGATALVHEVISWLESNGRRAEAAADFRYEPPGHSSDVGRLWQPNAFLSQVLPELDGGSALDLACGTGRDAVYMSSCGWDVTGVDVLPDALERAGVLARRCAAAIRPISWVQVDLEGRPVVWDRLFDLVTVIRYLHRPLFGLLSEWLRPGGSIVCETYTTLHRQRHGKPARDEHVLRPGELPRLLADFDIRHYSEDWRDDAHTARVWAVRPGA